MEAPKEMSKRAAEKAKKKLEKAKKKEEYALRPKQQPDDTAGTTTASSQASGSVFAEGWLKRVYEEKPVPVRTRFPPEPNGFLHIGHAKAIAVNFGFAKHHNGICFLRYDDTNPAKEEEIYFTAIQDMVRWLGFEPYQITYSSDHFDRLYELAEELIRRDKGYVCHCSRDEINLQRGGKDNKGPRFACGHRDRPIDESLEEFRAMRDGKYKPGEAHLRMKQSLTDLNEGNPQMWDLAAYRIVEKNHHHRTGDRWRIYPTYDFTHCLCDSFEEISHSLCTTEFFLSRKSYDWLLEVLDFKVPNSEEKGPMQREYGRLNVAGTILSKRRIQMLVDGTTVEVKGPDGSTTTKTIPPTVRGWDDPRLYTLVAIRRRGVPAEALLNFVRELGVTDALTNIQITRFEATVRKYLERSVPRLMLVLDPIPVVIEDLPEDYDEELAVPFDPKKPDGESRLVPLTRTVYIDRSDFREEDSPEFFRLAPGKAVGLLNVPFSIKATSFTKGDDGRVNEIRAVKVESNEKPKAFIHWVSSKGNNVIARRYNTLFNSEEPNALDWKEGGWADDLNPDSEVVHREAVVEPGIDLLMKGHAKHPNLASDDLVRFQAVRTGYFCIDPESEEGVPVLNQIVTLKEDSGKAK
ncbi:tRNA synthetases class I, catalytic domain-containing protein [Lineolata rhizophorae]|uniref:glutamine--tRNA ligase n=1 Tax=Lineolata rhizophorae TaxID=578093 RepID=A0A6A6NWV4_9PEZI|nr:tRNA synthetases class I, catalytic domain-containing protein [Lineolata rhizophorae]